MRPTDQNRDEAHALRRYVVARASGREHAEWARAEPHPALGFVAWTGCTEADANGRDDGKAFRRLRRPGQPWCQYLGADTTIAEDLPLQAYFDHHGADAHDWNRLRTEVSRNRVNALRTWRQKGREILARAHAQREGIPVAATSMSAAAAVFLKPGTGTRDLIAKYVGKRRG